MSKSALPDFFIPASAVVTPVDLHKTYVIISKPPPPCCQVKLLTVFGI